MGQRGELERNVVECFQVTGASSSTGEFDGGFRVVGDNGGSDEYNGGVQSWVFRCGGDKLDLRYGLGLKKFGFDLRTLRFEGLKELVF